MATTVSESTAPPSSSSSSSSWTDPYKEFELYLEKANEEIGAVFHQIEVSSRAKSGGTFINREDIASRFRPIELTPYAKGAVPPPVPVRSRRLQNQQPIQSSQSVLQSSNGQRRKAGLRITEDYYVGDLDLPLSGGKHLNGELRREFYPSAKNRKPSQHPLVYQRSSRNRWDVEYQRRTSCPGFQRSSYNGNGSIIESVDSLIDTDGLMTTAETGDDVQQQRQEQQYQQQQQQRQKKKKQNPRRYLRRYLTADSALQLTDNGRLATRHNQHSHHQSPYHPQAIQVWTTSLMAEFNHIIDGELQRLASSSNQQQPLTPLTGREVVAGRKRINSSPSSSTPTELALSPWARMQLALIDPVSDKTIVSNVALKPTPVSPQPMTNTTIQQLSADIDLVERQIFDDLDDLTLTLNQSLPLSLTESLASGSSRSGSSSTGSGAPNDETTHLSSPLLRPQELQDFLRRVEDSIRTSNTTLDRKCCHDDDDDDDEPSVDSTTTSTSPMSPTSAPSPPSLPSPPLLAMATPLDKLVSQSSDRVPTDQVDGAPNGAAVRPETPTFDAGTQTSPMSLSRSSSFLWISDCNCSGSLDGSVPIVSAPTSRHSEAGSSGVSRIVHMDTSMSSLISESSAGQQTANNRRRALRTPDSANDEDDIDDDDEDDDGGSSVSLSRSIDGGANGGGGGVESGIGTGSPPPRDRRRRPIPSHDHHAEVSVQTTLSQPESDDSSDLAVEDDDDEAESSSLSTDDEPDAVNAAAKKREKVRRRETWEKIRRRHSCKRVHSRSTRNVKDKPEVVWIRRGQSETPPPPPVPPHALPVGSAPVLTTLNSDVIIHPLLEPAPKVLHKPPVVIIQSVPARPKPRPLFFKNSTASDGTSSGLLSLDFNGTRNHHITTDASSPSSGVKMALQSVLSMELSSSKSSSTPFLIVGSGGARHLKPISASSTPTEPYVTLEAGLQARSHSESAFAELEATEACRWLRATGFPQYAQMYEDWQFPLDLDVVKRDHPFLDVDSLQALFRRLATLNRMAKLRSEKARIRPQGGDESEEEDQECALSDQWMYQRDSRRWSRIVDLPDDPSGLLAVAASAALVSAGQSEATEDNPDGNQPSGILVDDCSNDRTNDPVILGSFRRSSSERLRHGAKSLLRRMESLRSRSRRRPVLVRPADGSLVISGPQLVDATGMEDRMKELNCVDVSPPDSTSPTSSTPSPDLNRPAVKNQLLGFETNATASTSTATTPSTVESATPSPAGSIKIKRGFFQRRSFRPSTSSTNRSGSSTAGDDHKDAHSDSECSPSYWPRSPSSKDANSNETTAWNSLEQSLRWKSSKKSVRESIDSRASPAPSSDNQTQRNKLYLNFSKSSGDGGRSVGKNSGSLMSSPDEDDSHSAVSTPMVIRPPPETPTPCGSLRDAERMVETFGLHNDSASTGTGTSGSHIDSDYSPAAPGRNPVVVRWHSFRRSPSSTSVAYNSQPIAIGSLTVGQFALLRKLALLRLTALLERHTSSSKPSWGWDLPKFMRKIKSPDYKDKSMFGVPLSVTVQRTGESLPRPVMAAMHYLRQSALDQVGLFRKSGVRSRIAKLKELCEAWSWECSGPAGTAIVANGEDRPVDFSEHQPYDVADMVKQYFRELPEALMTNKLSETFVTIFQVVPANQRLDALRCALLLLPDEHREALQTFLAFLTDVAALASINQMTPSNLAVCLAPSLFHLPATALHSRSVNSSANNGGAGHTGNGNNSTNASSPRRRKTVGVPDQRELSQNKAAHDCLLQMINDFRHLFTVPEDIFRQCRCTYLEDSVPVSLDDLRTVEFGDWQAYMNGCMAALLKEAKEKSRGWESSSNDLRVDVAWKKVGDGHSLRLWRVSTEIEAPPGELLNRVLRERHLWDTSLVKWRSVVRLDKKSDVFHYTTSTEVPPVSRDVTLLRSWRTDLPRGTCLVAEMSIDHSDTPVTSGTVRSIVLASRYLIQPCGAGKCRIVHLSRVDIMGRSPEWYNKHYGHISALHMARIRDSFSQHLVADGPESKV